jgi:DNA-binding IscR family transcriptional regulator
VKVRGSVRAGEYIVPSGRNDGTGVAVSPEEIAVAEVGRVVGQALASRDGSGIGEVKLLVGLSETQLLERMLRRRDARMDDLEARIAALEAAIEQGTEQ